MTALASAYLFRGLGEEAMNDIAQLARQGSYAPNSFLFRAGDPAKHLYILEEGRVRLSIEGAGHLAHLVNDPGEAIGWSSMAGNGVYTLSAECVLPVKVFRLESEPLSRILERHPADGLLFYRRLATAIGRRLAESYAGTLSVHAQQDAQSYG